MQKNSMFLPVKDYNTIPWCRVTDLVCVRDLYTTINAIQFFAFFTLVTYKIVREKILTQDSYVGPLSRDNIFQLFCNQKHIFIAKMDISFYCQVKAVRINLLEK